MVWRNCSSVTASGYNSAVGRMFIIGAADWRERRLNVDGGVFDDVITEEFTITSGQIR